MKVNSNDQLDLIGLCLSKCDGFHFKNSFKLYMLDTVLNTWNQFTNDSYFSITGKNKSAFVISKRLFENFPQVFWKIEFITNVFSFGYENITGISSILIYVNFSPSPGTCDIDLKNGTTQTFFKIYCDNWTDRDGNVSYYSFYCKFQMLILPITELNNLILKPNLLRINFIMVLAIVVRRFLQRGFLLALILIRIKCKYTFKCMIMMVHSPFLK